MLSSASSSELKTLERPEELWVAEARDRHAAAIASWRRGDFEFGQPYRGPACGCWRETCGSPEKDGQHASGQCRCPCRLCGLVKARRRLDSIPASDPDSLRAAREQARRLVCLGGAGIRPHEAWCRCHHCDYHGAVETAVARLMAGIYAVEQRIEDEHQAWLASDAGQACRARMKARQEQREQRAEHARLVVREPSEAEKWDEFQREMLDRGPVTGLRSTGDELTDLRALVAAASASDRNRWALWPDGTVSQPYCAEDGAEFLGSYGMTFTDKGKGLIELRCGPCPVHQAEIIEDQQIDPSLPPWFCCDARCPVVAERYPVSTGKRIRSLTERIRAGGLWIYDFCREQRGDSWIPDEHFFAGARYNGYRWRARPDFSNETYQLAAADDLWPGTWPVMDIVQLPGVLREDGSAITVPGFDRASSLWVQPAGPLQLTGGGYPAIGQRPSLAARLLALAQRHGGRWDGGAGELAVAIGMPKSAARGLSAALKAPANVREMLALGMVAIQQGWTASRVKNWTVILKNLAATSDTSELMP